MRAGADMWEGILPSPELGRGGGNASIAVGGAQHRRGEVRFVQADTIIPNPGDPVAYDRFSYVRNNPVRYTDPSGHWYYDPGCDCLVDMNES